jgi:hypothetical protein
VFRGKGDARVAAAAVPEEAPAGPDTPEPGVMVDVAGLGIIAEGAPIFVPSVPVGETPAALFPTPADPVATVGKAAPVDPPREVVAEGAGAKFPTLRPVAAALPSDVGESVNDVGDIVEVVAVLVGIVAPVTALLLAGVVPEVVAPALFPDVLMPEASVVSSSPQDARASAKIRSTPVSMTLFTINLLYWSKTA